MSKIYVWSMKSSLHTNYRFRGTMKKLAIQIKREFAEVMNLKKIKPLTMNKQTVWVESDPINKDSILLTGGEEMKHVNKLESVYVLTEQEMNNVKREAAEKALEVAATMNHNSTPVSDGFIEPYLNSNYPITKNTEG